MKAIKVNILCLATCLLLSSSAVHATEWSTNLSSFHGGSYDGWDRNAMTNTVGLGGALVSLSSGINQLFDWRLSSAALAALTIAAEDPVGKITNGGTMRVSVPSAWLCRFDTNATVTYSGNAAGKVNPATFSGDGRTLQIPVTNDFVAADTLTVSGLKLADLRRIPETAPSGDTQRLELDFTGTTAADRYDLYTVEIRVQWLGGSYDGWDQNAMTNAASLVPPPRGTIITLR